MRAANDPSTPASTRYARSASAQGDVVRYIFPYRKTAGGTLKIEMQDSKPGDFEIVSDKYFSSLGKVNEEIETDLGTLRLADMDFNIVDRDRKFRDGIFGVDDRKFVKLLYEERQNTFIPPKAIDLDGSTEYLSSPSTDFDMNGPEEMTNTGFEIDTAGWTLNTKSGRSSLQAHSGTWSIKDDGAGVPVYNEYVFPSNRMYQVTAEVWCYITSYTSGTIKIELLDASNNVLATKSANTGTIGSWQKLPINLDSILLRKIRLHNTGTAVVHWDDVSVTRAWDLTIAAWVKVASWPGGYTFAGLVDKSGTSGLSFRLEGAGTTGFSGYVGSVALGTGSVSLGNFHLGVMTVKRSGSLRLFVDGVEQSNADVSGQGRLDLSSTMYLGRLPGGSYLLGLLGEVMIIKGWAADAVTIADWFTNGIRMRNDTIGFWRWQHATDVGRDYSGQGHSLTPVNVDSNDVKPDEPRGLFAPYKQRAQANQTLFYGIAKMATSGHDEKRDIVKLLGYSPIKDLENTTIPDLWSAIQLAGYAETKTMFIPEVAGDPIFQPPTVQAVSVANVLRTMGSLVGCPLLLLENGWRFMVEAGATYAIDFGFENLYVITNWNSYGVFDTDFTRSKLSWGNLYKNCLELLKALQLASFSFASGCYDADASTGILSLRQRGLPGQSAVIPVGKLLEYTKESINNNGIIIKNLYDAPASPPPSPNPTQAEVQTQYGTGEVEVELPFKTYERRRFDYPYTYLFASWLPSTNQELITNGDFETNTTGWTLNGASTRDNTRAFTGTWSLKDAGASGTYNEWIIPVDLPNELIEVTGNLWSTAGSTTAVKIELIGFNGQVLRSYSTRVNAQWQDLQDLLAIGVKKIRLYGNTAANPVWWDTLSAKVVVPGHLTNGIFVVNKVLPHGYPLNGAPYPNLHSALANAYGISSVGKKDLHVRTFHRPLVTKDGTVSMDRARVLEREEFVYRAELMNLETVRTVFDIEKNTMTRWGTKR